MVLDYCDKSLDPCMIHGGVYLKRLSELGLLDLDKLCGRLNYSFFANHTVLEPDSFGQYSVSEIVDIIKEKSMFGSVLK